MPKNYDMDLARRIARARIDQGLEARQVAESLGISTLEYLTMEEGLAFVSSPVISQLSLILDKPIAWFFDQTPKQVKIPLKRKIWADEP